MLLAGEIALSESNTICRFLAGAAGRSDLLPDEPLSRAAVEMWMDWQATELNPAWSYAFMALVRRHPDYADPIQVERSRDRWNRKMAILDARLAHTGAYVAGPGFSLADIVCGLSFHRWRSTPMDRPRLPAIEAWAARLAARSAFARYTSDP